jgi:hypothetical protein
MFVSRWDSLGKEHLNPNIRTISYYFVQWTISDFNKQMSLTTMFGLQWTAEAAMFISGGNPHITTDRSAKAKYIYRNSERPSALHVVVPSRDAPDCDVL